MEQLRKIIMASLFHHASNNFDPQHYVFPETEIKMLLSYLQQKLLFRDLSNDTIGQMKAIYEDPKKKL